MCADCGRAHDSRIPDGSDRITPAKPSTHFTHALRTAQRAARTLAKSGGSDPKAKSIPATVRASRMLPTDREPDASLFLQNGKQVARLRVAIRTQHAH